MRGSSLAILLGSIAAAGAWAASDAPRQASGRQCAATGGGVALVPAGAAAIGEDGADRPGTKIRVPAFRIDRTEVTNRQFAAFVAATGYVTEAERQGEGAVFVPPASLDRGLEDAGQWWRMIKGASWHHPHGSQSTIDGRPDEPVVQVTYGDAKAYAAWRGGTLPTELQWERAARGTQDRPIAPEAWHQDEAGRPTANVWDGIFPLVNSRQDGFAEIAPVACFPANGLGLYDMVGNVWEWTAGERDLPGPLRGGSYLCAANYCANYRPMGRQEQEGDLATSHAGFRVAYAADFSSD